MVECRCKSLGYSPDRRRRHAQLARQAYRLYGKGVHRAKLNLADCAAYALAMDEDEPLLFAGEEFSRTDVRAAVDA